MVDLFRHLDTAGEGERLGSTGPSERARRG